MYYPIGKASTPMHEIDAQDLGIRARYLKLTFDTDSASKYAVWALSELAIWGRMLP